jgi:peptidylprolyl isomerase
MESQMRTSRLIVLIVSLALIATACGGGSDTETSEPTSSTGSTVAPEVTNSTQPATATAEPQIVDLDTKPVVTSDGGPPPASLVSLDLSVGDGEEAVAGSLVDVHYVGVLHSDGSQFDASWDRGQTFQFQIGGGQVIQGWDVGVEGMRVGGRRQLTIPAALAYGDRSPSPAIPAGSALIFVVDLVSIVPPFPTAQFNDDGSVTISNQGGDFEGHLPWNTQGEGPGLFAGDEISDTFPSDDGVEMLLTFNVEDVEIPQDVSLVSAILTSRALQVAGTPFVDLGPLIASPVVYDTFPPADDERAPTGPESTCEPNLEESRLTCDVTAAMVDLLDGDDTRASFRLRFTVSGDADGEPDIAVFFFRDPNMNERGIFTLELAFG